VGRRAESLRQALGDSFRVLQHGGYRIRPVRAIAALEQGEGVIARLRDQYRRGRDIVMEVLSPHPRIEILEPEGAFYAFPRVKGLKSSLAFAKASSRKRTSASPRYTFGPGNEEHFRVCFAQSHDRLREGLERILRYIDRHEG